MGADRKQRAKGLPDSLPPHFAVSHFCRALSVFAMLVSGCAMHTVTYVPPPLPPPPAPVTYTPPPPPQPPAIITRASWYGPGFENHKTATGERFKSEKMTAAAKGLPL